MPLLLEYDGPTIAAVICDVCNWQTAADPLSYQHAIIHVHYCRPADGQFKWPQCTWPRYPHSHLYEHQLTFGDTKQ